MRRRKITKRELRYMSGAVLTAVVIGILSDPFDTFFSNFFPDNTIRVAVGLILGLIVLYLFKVN
ncbi:MAG: hypothetical protein AABY22_23455 [Nanoarchaeota archaeon]